MKVDCLQENLQKSLSLVARIASQKGQLPALLNVLLSAKKNSFSLWATDLDLGIRVETPAKIEEEGEITVPAKLLFEFVSSLLPGKVELEAKGTTLGLKTQNQKASFSGIPASEFPTFDDKKGVFLLSLEGDSLRKIIKNIAYAASSDESRPILSGVLLKSDGKNCFFVATDGYRLSFKEINEKTKEGKGFALIIPARLLKELGFLIDKEDGEGKTRVDVFITPQQNQIRFGVGGGVLVGRLIEGEFPNFEKIIPQGAATTAVVDREELLKSIKIASVFARDSANIIKLAIKKDGFLISANAPQIGENQSLVEAQVKGDENKIAFNGRYLLEFLVNLEEKELIFEMTGSLNPCIFKVKGESSFFHLIMPVRIQE